MCKVWGVVTRKGGVGKTTTSTTMAYLLAKAGYKVALIDFDGQRHSTKLSGVIDGWFRMQNVKVFGYDYDDFVETDEHTCLMLTRRKWSFRKFVKSIILKVKGMW